MRPLGADGAPKPGGMIGSATLQVNVDASIMENGDEIPTCWKLDNHFCDWVASFEYGERAMARVTTWFTVVLVFSACGCCVICLNWLLKLAHNLLIGYGFYLFRPKKNRGYGCGE